jgi:hypothetical protein
MLGGVLHVYKEVLSQCEVHNRRGAHKQIVS